MRPLLCCSRCRCCFCLLLLYHCLRYTASSQSGGHRLPLACRPQELAPALQLVFRSSVSPMSLFFYLTRTNILIILNNSVDSSRSPHKPSLDDKSAGDLFPVDVRWMELRRCGADRGFDRRVRERETERERVLKPKKDRAPIVQLKFSKCGLAGSQKNVACPMGPYSRFRMRRKWESNYEDVVKSGTERFFHLCRTSVAVRRSCYPQKLIKITRSFRTYTGSVSKIYFFFVFNIFFFFGGGKEPPD